MPESRIEEKEIRTVYQDLDPRNVGPDLRETDCLDIPQASAVWRVVEREKSSKGNLQTFIALPLQTGQKVYCRDGYAGKITGLNLNPFDNIDSFVVEIGRIIRRRVIAPIQWVVRIETENVDILGRKGDLIRLPEIRPDSTLIREVDRTLRKDTGLLRTVADQIHVSAQDGVISLDGYVSNTAQKNRAEETARRVPRVIAVQQVEFDSANLNLPGAQPD